MVNQRILVNVIVIGITLFFTIYCVILAYLGELIIKPSVMVFVIIMTGILTLEGAFLGKFYMATKTTTADHKFLDFWSYGHLMVHVFIVFLLIYLLDNTGTPFLISLGLAIVWEIIEYMLIPINPNFALENNKNRISDLINALIGSTLAVFIFNNFLYKMV